MGWETRGNGSYYYRKKRLGGKVVSEYVGGGVAAHMLALIDQEDREEKRKVADLIGRERDNFNMLSLQADKVNSLIKRFMVGVLLMSGFHKHKGQWRRRRYGR